MTSSYINRIKSFHFLKINNILAFILGIFYLPFFPPGGKKVDPYFRENESSEASGILLLHRTHIKVLKDALAHSGLYQTLMWVRCSDPGGEFTVCLPTTIQI